MKKNQNFLRIFPTLLILFALTGCNPSPNTRPAILGIDESIQVNTVELRVEDVLIQGSYSIHYIMQYATTPYTFLKVTLQIQGFTQPQEALNWCKENIRLWDGKQNAPLAHAGWIILGEDVSYKSGEDFDYRYFLIFKILADSDPTKLRLLLPENQQIQLESLIPLPEDGTKSGQDNKMEGGTVGGGDSNIASGPYAVVSGGSQNTAGAYHTSVGGGFLNASQVAYSTVSGGRENSAENLYTTIGGGYANTASGRDSTIGGGSRNAVTNYHATIGGGIRNLASASDTTISGGGYNLATDTYATVGGGTQNEASGSGSTVSGGSGNLAGNDHATVSGGLGNQALGTYASIGGGTGNIAQGSYSTIAGGTANIANGDYSFAVGQQAVIQESHPGVFIFSDATNAKFTSSTANEFAVRATGGIRFITGTGPDGSTLSGAILSPGSGSWASLSDQNAKENFAPVDENQILEFVVGLPISEWNYRSEDDSVRHLGPMAQDFYAAFGLGTDEKYISSIDADGVTLAAIQGLYHLIEEKDSQLSAQQDQIEQLQTQIAEIKQQDRMESFILFLTVMVSILCLLSFSNIRKKIQGKMVKHQG